MTKKQKNVRVQDLVGLLNAFYPPALSESWDNVGLQVGDPAAPVVKALICLDPSEKALRFARDVGAQAILSHHPLIFSPMKSIVPFNETGRIVTDAIRSGIAILCAHTNLDRAAGGLNDWFASVLDLIDPLPLDSSKGDLVKLVVFVPIGHESDVSEALYRAGCGHVGRYDRCSFAVQGVGTFRPGEGATPYIGTVGSDERADELRLETILPAERISSVVDKMLKAHPYEEVAYDLVPLLNRRAGVGLGRIGRIAEPVSLETFAERVKERLSAESLRIVGNLQTLVRKVALCGGSGASLLSEAARQGADVFVTGDVKYHEARKAEDLGLALIDAGHFATESLMVRNLARVLAQETVERGMAIEFIEMEGEMDPFRVI